MLLNSSSFWVWFCAAALACSDLSRWISCWAWCSMRANRARHQRCSASAVSATQTRVRAMNKQGIYSPKHAQSSLGFSETVAYAAHGVEKLRGRAELVAQAPHVRIDRAGINQAVC